MRSQEARLENLVERLEDLENKLALFSKDLKVLQKLHHIQDPQGQLNKIRYISEGILQLLCKNHNVGWGKSEPTLERMIGPLRAQKILPAPIASHLRSIQSTTSPGSHYQMDKLSESHVQIAMLALIELLDWYLSESGEELHLNRESGKQIDASSKPAIQTAWIALIGVGMVAVVIYVLYFRLPANHPVHKNGRVEVMQHEYMKIFSKRHFLTIQLVSQFTNKFGQDDEMVNQSLTSYRAMISDYNMNRGVLRQDMQLIFGDEVYLLEREVHNELFYANKNLECMIHNQGDSQKLATTAKIHLEKANEKHRELNALIDAVMTVSLEWPLPVTRQKQPIDATLENPC